MAAWATGLSLGPYVLLAPLGAGGMGEVWKARDTRLDRIVAVKRLKTTHSARFEQEARDVIGDGDGIAHWLEKAMDQQDPFVLSLLRTWYGRPLRNTPHWSRLLRKLNLPE